MKYNTYRPGSDLPVARKLRPLTAGICPKISNKGCRAVRRTMGRFSSLSHILLYKTCPLADELVSNSESGFLNKIPGPLYPGTYPPSTCTRVEITFEKMTELKRISNVVNLSSQCSVPSFCCGQHHHSERARLSLSSRRLIP